MLYDYFVSYSHAAKDRPASGFGCINLKRKKPITKYSDIKDIIKAISDDLTSTGYLNREVIILNYTLLRKRYFYKPE